MPIYELWTGWNSVEPLINSNSQLNKNGKSLYTSCALGEFLKSAFKYTLDRWNNIQPSLTATGTSRMGLTPDRIYYIINDPLFRRITTQIAKTHKSTSKLIKIFHADSNLTAYKRDPTHADFANIQDKEWASILLHLTLIADRENRKRIIDLKIRREKHFINEALRPHLIEVPVANIISFILKTYNQNMSVTLTDSTKLEPGQIIYNAKGHKLFLLACNSEYVTFHNEHDKMFYKQRLAGVEIELNNSIYALVTQKTRYITQVIKLPIAFMDAIFPQLHINKIFFAAQVISAAQRIQHHWDELERFYKNIRLSANNIEKIIPSMLLDVIKDVITAGAKARVKAAAAKMLDPKQMELPLDKWLIAILKISMEVITDYYTGKIFSDTAVTILAKIWDSIKSVIRIVWTVLKNSVIPFVTGVYGRKDDEKNIENLAAKLAETGLKNAKPYARMLIAHSLPTIDLLIREFTELERNGTEFFNLLSRSTAW
jgi:hypothetical protein